MVKDGDKQNGLDNQLKNMGYNFQDAQTMK